MFKNKFLESWSLLTQARKPIIAAVSGYAVRPPPSPSPLLSHSYAPPRSLEAAANSHSCATSSSRPPPRSSASPRSTSASSPAAVEPRYALLLLPSFSYTHRLPQRLARAIGKSRTMELTLTGRNFTAAEAAAWGLVSRVSDDVLADALDVAGTIASKSAIAVQAGKEAVNAAYEGTLAEGLRYERRLFHGLFATNDQKEGTCIAAVEGCGFSWLMVCACRDGGVCGKAQADLDALVKDARGRSITTCTTAIAMQTIGYHTRPKQIYLLGNSFDFTQLLDKLFMKEVHTNTPTLYSSGV